MTQTETQPQFQMNATEPAKFQLFLSKYSDYLKPITKTVGKNTYVYLNERGFKDRDTIEELKQAATPYGGVYVIAKTAFIFPNVAIDVPKGFTLLYLNQPDIEDGGPQPRLQIRPDDPETVSLFGSIKLKGQEDPIQVYPSPLGNGKHRICEGHRRRMVCFTMLQGNYPTGPGIWAVEKQRTERDAYEAALLLNEKALVKLEDKAAFYLQMMEKFPEYYPNYDAIAKRVNVTHQQIYDIILTAESLKKLKTQVPEEVASTLAQQSTRTLNPIRRSPENLQPAVAKAIVTEGLKSEAVRQLVTETQNNPSMTEKEVADKAAELKEWAEKRFQTHVDYATKVTKKVERQRNKLLDAETGYPENLVKALYGHYSAKDKRLTVEELKDVGCTAMSLIFDYAVANGLDLDRILNEAEAWQKP